VEPAGVNGSALAVYRGALLYALRLDETFVETAAFPSEPRAVDYIVEQPGCDAPNKSPCAASWNAALVVGDPAHPEAGFTFSRVGDIPPVPFAAGRWGASNLQLTASVRQVSAWGVELGAAAPPPASPVDCSAAGACGPAYVATWVPYGATHLRMSVLPWTAPPPCGNRISYNGSASAVLPGNAAGILPQGDASIVANGPDQNLRSGDPGQVSLTAWEATLVDASHAVSGLSFAFQYVAGYGGDGAPGAAVMELVALKAGPCDAAGTVIASLYKSAELSHFPFDGCNTCYSPPQNVSLTGLNLDVTTGIVLGLRITNNQRNVQIKLPLPITVEWA